MHSAFLRTQGETATLQCSLQIAVIGTPRVKKGMFTGPRYDLSADEFAEQKA